MSPGTFRLRSLAIIAGVLLVVGMLGTTFAQTPTRGGTLTIGQVTDLVNLDPAEIGQSDGAFKWQVFDTLVRLKKDLTVVPEDAASWEFSADHLKLTFHIRPGVYFQNGRELTSQDVAFNIKRVQDPATGSKLRQNSLAITSIETPDDHTLVVGFDKPNPTVFDFFSRLWLGAPEMFKNKTTAIGTGPFEFVKWVPGDHVELKAFDKFWKKGADGKPLPYLDGITIKVLPDKQSLVANLQAGAIDMARLIPLTSMDTVKSDPRFDVQVSDSGSNYYAIGFVVNKPPLNNVKVREALNLTIERQRFVKVFQHGAGQATCVPWPKNSPAYNEAQATSCFYNIDKAKQLLAEAGYAKGFPLTLAISRQITPDSEKLVQMWQQDLKQVNVDLKIKEISAAVWKQKKANTQFDQAWADLFGNTNRNPAIPFLQARPFLPDTNPSDFHTAEYTKMVNELAVATDPAQQKTLYNEMTAYLLKEAFINPVTYQPQIWAFTKKLHGFTYTINDKDRFEAAYLQ